MALATRAVVIALLLALTEVVQPLAGPAHAGPAPARGGTLTYAAPAGVDNLDPALTGGTISAAVKDLIYSSLVDETPSREIKPDLAVSWKADGTAWTLNLRRGDRDQRGGGSVRAR